VYQAYSSTIAVPAVREQKLDASPAFKVGRMTWVKPSFLWCMYRSGWSYKDANQERILAIEMSREGLGQLVRCSVGAMGRDRPGAGAGAGRTKVGVDGKVETETETETGTGTGIGKEKEKEEKEKANVRFQWDPERDVRLGRLPHRSLQLGISSGMVQRWIDEWIVRIEDVTEDVRRLHALIENEGDEGVRKVVEELKGEQWREDVLQLNEELERILGITPLVLV